MGISRLGITTVKSLFFAVSVVVTTVLTAMPVLGQQSSAKLEVTFSSLDDSKTLRRGSDELTLPAGHEVNLEISCTNQTGMPIEFDDVTTTCSCSRPDVSSKVFDIDKPLKVRLKWKLPAMSAEGMVHTTLSFFRNKSLCLQLVVSANLSHSLYVGGPNIGERGRDGFTLWQVPLSCTEPVELADLQVILDEQLHEFSAKIVEVTPTAADPSNPRLRRGVIEFVAPKVATDRGDLFGRFSVIVSEPKIEYSTAAVFSARKVIKYSPMVMSFRPTENDASRHEARGVLQLDKSYFMDPEKGVLPISFHVEIDGQKVAHETQHIGNQVYRLTVQIAARESTKEEVNYVILARQGGREVRVDGIGVWE